MRQRQKFFRYFRIERRVMRQKKRANLPGETHPQQKEWTRIRLPMRGPGAPTGRELEGVR